ncbi:MAG: lipopolysaccharide assembly protein LapA domain-containing protein [Dongiaceae bacterium]
MKHSSWIVTLPATAVAVVFAVANRAPASVDFWPLPWVVELPIYLLVLGGLVLGFFIGAGVAWLSAGKRRRQTRRLRERSGALAQQLAELRRRQPPPPGSAPLALETDRRGAASGDDARSTAA